MKKNVDRMCCGTEVSQSEIEWLDELKGPFFIPEKGFVSDRETAIRIAEAVWIQIYGKECIEREKPFRATLVEGIWYVTGTLPGDMEGGVAMAKISQKDGRIITVIHSQ